MDELQEVSKVRRKKVEVFHNLEGLKAKTTIEALLKSRTSSQPNIETSQKRTLKKSKNKSSARLNKETGGQVPRKGVDSGMEKKLKKYNNTVSTACGDSKKNNSSLTRNKKSNRSTKAITFNQMKIMSPQGATIPYLDLGRKKSITRHLSPGYGKSDNSQQVILDILQRKNSLNCFKKLLKGKQVESTMNSMRLSKPIGNSTRMGGQTFARKSSSKKSLNKQSINDKEKLNGNISPDPIARSSYDVRSIGNEDALVNPRILDAMNDVYEKLHSLLYNLKAPMMSKNQSCAESVEISEKKKDPIRKHFLPK